MFIHVAVPVPGLDLLTYAVPEGTQPPAVGARVLVPLGSRIVTGIVIERGARPIASQFDVKPLRQVLDERAFVPAEVVALARWTAEYYAAGVGDTIPALLPPMARGARRDAHKTRRIAAINQIGRLITSSLSLDDIATTAAEFPPIGNLPATTKVDIGVINFPNFPRSM